MLAELRRMYAYLQQSEKRAYNPRDFCNVYVMDQQPLNTSEQKDMQEFFTDLVSKLEECASPNLKALIKRLFAGTITNLVMSLDCEHVSCVLEPFYTVRCQVAGMRDLTDALNEITVKDTLEGDNMYTCSKCGKKVRAEKRACFRQLPQILCFNTMRYTFNMVTMLKEKVNTHFSFPMQLNMSGYMEKNLIGANTEQVEASVSNGATSSSTNSDEEESFVYDLIGVTVHTGTAEGGHYYSFIKVSLFLMFT
jgi:ubiquitin carboxyl-terminal hydrolase 34